MVPRKYLVLVSSSGALISLDQLSKFWASSQLKLGETRPVVDLFLNLSLVRNSGAAFGLFSNLRQELRDPLFLFVPVLTLLVIFFAFTRLRDSQAYSIGSFCLIIGGAFGNILDRLRLGYVVDFLDFHWNSRAHFPAFNVADAAISLGVLVLFVGIFWEKNGEDPS